jgi:hypothetical protein
MAQDRQLIQLAISRESLEAVAIKMQRAPECVAKIAKRLGVSLKTKK